MVRQRLAMGALGLLLGLGACSSRDDPAATDPPADTPVTSTAPTITEDTTE